MRRLISAKTAGIIVLLLLLGLLILHIFILMGIISFDLVWGGNIETRAAMINLEVVALITTSLFLLITIYQIKFLYKKIHSRLINIAIWIMFVYFTLNIIGNLAANTGAERMIFTPATILLSLFPLRLALAK